MFPKLNFCILILAILFPITTFSQETQPIRSSFDFEDYADWGDFGNPDYIKGIDTLIARSGKNSAFIESKNGAETFGAFSYAIPADFVGEKIKLSGYIKTENVKGFAGLWMRLDPKAGFYNMYDKEVNGTTEWQKYEIELKYDQKAESVVIGGLLSGKGKMWLDDLEVTIDGKKLERAEKKVQLTPEVRQTLVQQIDRHKNELDLSSDEKLETSLQSLIESIGDKKIVAIGEDTHGTSEYYKLREAITRKLISEKGFNMVVLENPYDDIEVLVRDLQQDNLDNLMQKHLFSIYQTREMRSFLDWYKKDEIKNTVQFKGCDDSYWVLPGFLEQQLSDLNDSEIKDLAEKLKDASSLTLKQYNKKYKRAAKAKSENALSAITYEAATALEEALKGKDLLTPKLEEYLFNIQTSYINYLHLANNRPIQSRDEMMARRIARFAEDPDSKIIVWAHNAHISNVIVMDGEIGIMGQNLKEEFGEEYHSVGMSSLNGSYSYIENRFINNDHLYDDKLLKAELNSQPENSWERIFSETGSNAFYFETEKLDGSAIYENIKLLGYGRETETDYFKLSPLEMFDSVFFIETTAATQPLFN